MCVSVWNHSDENCIVCMDVSQFALLFDFGRINASMVCRSAVLVGSLVTLAVMTHGQFCNIIVVY